jgi:hypothetical protein
MRGEEFREIRQEKKKNEGEKKKTSGYMSDALGWQGNGEIRGTERKKRKKKQNNYRMKQ